MNSFLKRLLPLALLPALAVGLAACDSTGDDDDDDGGTPVVNPLDAIYDTTGTEIRVSDAQASGIAAPNGTVTWEAGFTYVLSGRVFVNAGQTLEIQPGTVVKGEPGLRENASALIVARGGRLLAEGTAAEPIVFTALADNVDDATDEPGAGSWGGLIVLGSASSNNGTGTAAIEGIPTTETRGLYGCGDAGFACDDDDDSGVIRYVSIRYGGSEIGEGNEINGLTMGGVGRGTIVEYVEVFGNQDDGFEWFGGTVNGRYLVAAFCGDEAFDTDQGYRGTNQFVFGIQRDGAGDNGFEMDGAEDDFGPIGATPFSTPTFANVTVVGNGEDRAVRIKENAAPRFYRAHFANFERGITIEDTEGTDDSRARFEAGDGEFGQGSVLFGAFLGDFNEDGQFGDPIDVAGGEDYTLALLTAANATFFGENTGVVSVSTSPDGGLDPTAAGPALDNVGALPPNGFLQEDGAGCIGAVCPGSNWLGGWTALSRLGYLAGDA